MQSCACNRVHADLRHLDRHDELVDAYIWVGRDDSAPGEVDTLAAQVAAKAPLLAFEALGKGADRALLRVPLRADVGHIGAVDVHGALELQIIPVVDDVPDEGSHQRSSVANRGHPQPSVAVREAIRMGYSRNQRQSTALNGNPGQSRRTVRAPCHPRAHSAGCCSHSRSRSASQSDRPHSSRGRR